MHVHRCVSQISYRNWVRRTNYLLVLTCWTLAANFRFLKILSYYNSPVLLHFSLKISERLVALVAFGNLLRLNDFCSNWKQFLCHYYLVAIVLPKQLYRVFYLNIKNLNLINCSLITLLSAERQRTQILLMTCPTELKKHCFWVTSLFSEYYVQSWFQHFFHKPIFLVPISLIVVTTVYPMS